MDNFYMKHALDLAKKGSGFTNPNPLVGAVIVLGDQIIGEGYHEHYGESHAEINALKNANRDVDGATMYVTLEPCSHYGKTPPCVNAVIESGIKRVVVGMMDPNPIVSGRGIKLLRENGVEVTQGVLVEDCMKLNEIFVKYITKKLPFTILKTAMTLDGKIATITGDSKWISNEKSREYVHEIRQRVSGIMVGVGTVIEDNPMLTTRIKGKETKNPVRIIVDTSAKISLESNIVRTSQEVKTILATTQLAPNDKIASLKKAGMEILICPIKEDRVDLKQLLIEIGRLGIDSILIEGGGTLSYALLKEELIDKLHFFIAPKLVGGENAKTPIEGKGIEYMKDAIILNNIEVERIENDILIEGYPQKGGL